MRVRREPQNDDISVPSSVLERIQESLDQRYEPLVYFLITEIHRVLEEYGCHHSLVGTPKTNQKGIKLYKKAGYQPVFEQIEFEKMLR